MGGFNIVHVVVLVLLIAGPTYLLTRKKQIPATTVPPIGSTGAILKLTPTEQMLLEQRLGNDGPNITLAYVLWLFLGLISGHRFYLGRPGSAVLQIISYILIVGFIWWIIDAFLIPDMIRQKRNALREGMAVQILTMRELHAAAASAGLGGFKQSRTSL